MSITELAPIQEWYRLALSEQVLSRQLVGSNLNNLTDDVVSLQLKIDNVKSIAVEAIKSCEVVDFGDMYRRFSMSDLQFMVEAFDSSACLKELVTYHALSEEIETQIFKIVPRLRHLKSLFIKYGKSNQFLREYNFLKHHQSIESLKIHFQYDMTDELSLQLQDMLKYNRFLRTVEFIGWNQFNDKHLAGMLGSLAQNSTLMELRLNSINCYVADKELLAYGNAFHTTLDINPNLVLHMNTKNSSRIFTHTEVTNINQAAVDLMRCRSALILLKSVLIDDVVDHMLSLLTSSFVLDQRLLVETLIDRKSIGNIHNSFKFNSNELIRECHHWKAQK
ncbi:hypothetical protein HDV02_005744 [Globomyces sp. JEL0801]|nr:hypothetical protein HDV02_005744 [Globomyces sp. JEL0801]